MGACWYMEKPRWSSVSIPTELIKEVENKKPSWQTVAEFVRFAIRRELDKTPEQPRETIESVILEK